MLAALAMMKVAPLYALVACGFVAGRWLPVRKETVATLLLYFFVPAVMFFGALTAKLTPSWLALPAITYGIGAFVAALYASGLRALKWRQPVRGLLAFASCSANAGYFGVPMAVALFGPERLPAMVVAAFGYFLFENTLGFYIAARGRFSRRESVRRVTRLPSLYAFAAGLFLNWVEAWDAIAQEPLGVALNDLSQHLRGAFTALGMMMVGFGIADAVKLGRFRPDWRFTGVVLSGKFVAWPLMLAGALAIDHWCAAAFGFGLDLESRQLLVMLGAVPVAANTVSIATELGTEPERMSVAALVTTLVALAAVPVAAAVASALR